MDILTHIGSRIRLYRKQKGLMLKDLADELHVSSSTLSKYENGKATIDVITLFEIAEALNISVNQLINCKKESNDPVRNNVLDNHFFKKKDVYYMYQYFGTCKVIYTCVLEIIHNASTAVDVKEDSVFLYYDCKSEEDYSLCQFIYTGTVTYSDLFTNFKVRSLYNNIDEVHISAKVPFSTSEKTTGILTAISQTIRNPYAAKVVISTHPLKKDQELMNELQVTDKEFVSNMKRSNAFVIY